MLIGDPIPFDDLLLDMVDSDHISRGTLYDAVSSRIGNRLHDLKIQVDRLALEQSLEEAHDSSLNAKLAIGILQHVDWEAFNIGSYISAEESPSVLNQAIKIQPKPHSYQLEEPRPANRCVRMGFSYEGGMMSRIRGYMDPTELMGFAVKGLFMNNRTWKENHISIREVRPLKAWQRFVQANNFQQWHYM